MSIYIYIEREREREREREIAFFVVEISWRGAKEVNKIKIKTMGIKRVKKMEIKCWIKSNSKLKNHGEEEEFFLFEREF